VLVVTDLLHTSKRTVDAWRAAGADWVVQINDSGSFAVGADAYVDVDATRLDLSRPPDAPIASGFEFALVHEAVRQARPLSSVELAGQPRLLLTCGGADPGCVTESVVDALDRWRGGTLTVLCGAGWTCARRDAMHRRARAGRLVLDAQPSLIARMLEHDVVVTIGGATALEACCLGRSVVVVPWAHLARHAARMARLGLAHVVEPRGLRRLLADADALRRRARAGFEAVDGRGAERIIDFLLKRLPSEGDPR
jgi:spore coat polysaccharide biosynthesis predicted glycosyltransferase SpsG